MTSESEKHGPEQSERIALYALQALTAAEMSAIEAHVGACAECRRELEALRPVVHSFAGWPTDVLRPPVSLWGRLAQQIAAETGVQSPMRVPQGWQEPDWKEAAPGISVKLLAADAERNRVSMLVKLGPGVDYPPHTHAGVEELHLLDGELWIDDRKLYPGDYSRAEPGTADKRVWSETGCTCVLITSSGDVLG
jgi:anti-sigma factor ChrR (cupin superfamily)